MQVGQKRSLYLPCGTRPRESALLVVLGAAVHTCSYNMLCHHSARRHQRQQCCRRGARRA